MASALAALQSQLQLGPLLMPNHLGLGNLGGMSPQDLGVLSQAFQQVQQASLQQQLQSYMELLHSSANSLGQQKNTNTANAQVQAAAQFFQVSIQLISVKKMEIKGYDKISCFLIKKCTKKSFPEYSRWHKQLSNCRHYKSNSKLRIKHRLQCRIHRFIVHQVAQEFQRRLRF